MMRLTAPVVLPCDEPCTVLRDAAVDVDAAGRISYVGPTAAAPPAPGPELALTGILMPGLINTHAHTAMTALRGLGGDLPLMRWLTEVIWPAEARVDAEDVRIGMLVGALEMLGAGITTSVEMYFHNDAVVDAVLAAGSRAVVTPGIIAVPGWDRLGTWQQMLDGISRWIDVDGIRFGPGERIELGYGPHAAYTLPAEALTAAGAAARERGALLHIHVAETTGEDTAIREEHGSVPLLLERLGVLGSDDSGRGSRVLAAHAVQLSDADIAVLARHGAGVAHCPGSNSKLASGIARLVDLRAAGIAVGLGTDGPASHDDLNLWDDIRLAARLARLSTGDAAALTAAQALLLATRGG
ncbi:MAG: amidohydrolase family protein, partial [Actinomycetota bacterium]|nr:amidohydrolase family protein [Actinomycetota bacterium]